MGTANLTTMPPRVCIQVVILMLAMSFALAESNSKEPSAPGWIGGCKTPDTPPKASSDSGCPAKCLSGEWAHDKDKDPKTGIGICGRKCAHKWEYSSNKGPYLCQKTRRKRSNKKNKKSGHTATCQDHTHRRKFDKETLWCPKEAQTNPTTALRLIKGVGGKFPVEWKKWTPAQVKDHKTSPVEYEAKAKGCKLTNIPKSKMKELGITPVPLKFLTSEPHRKYKTDSKKFQAHEKRKKKARWSNFGNGIEMYPWVKPGISNCSPDTPANFINYYEDLATYVPKEDKIGQYTGSKGNGPYGPAECNKISRRNSKKSEKVKIKNKDGKIKYGTAQLVHQAGRCKFHINVPWKDANFCAEQGQPFFCAKKYAETTTVYETIRVDKMKKKGRGKGKEKKRRNGSKYFTLKISLTMKMRKANMCERMWRHLPYTCSVKKVTEPILVVVEGCEAYTGGKDKSGNKYPIGKGDNSGPPPRALCKHYKDHFSKAHQMNPDPKEIPVFKGSVSIRSWEGFTNPAPAIPHVAAIEASLRAFVSMK